MESRAKVNPTRTSSSPAQVRSICQRGVEAVTDPAGPKVLRAPSPAPVSETELLKLDRVTAAVTGGEPRCRRQDSPASNSVRARSGRNKQTAVPLPRLWKSSLNRIRSTLRKLGSSSCKVKYYWKYHSEPMGSCT